MHDPEYDQEPEEPAFDRAELEEIGDDDEEEFSLDTLSQVYAKFRKDNPSSSAPSSSAPSSSSASDLVDSGQSLGEFQASIDDQGNGEPVEPTRPSGQPGGKPGGKTDFNDSSQPVAQQPGELVALTPDDDAHCALTPESIIEAILFIGSPVDVKLTPKKIAGLLRDVSPKEVGSIVKKLNARYQAEGAVYRISSVGGNLSMGLERSMADFQHAIFGKSRAIRLPPAAIEVLAVVAYHQPVSRNKVEELRKKPSGQLLLQLTRRGLLEMITNISQPIPQPKGDEKEPASEKSNRGKLFVTTDKFLDLMGLDSIHDLPQSHEIDDIDQVLG